MATQTLASEAGAKPVRIGRVQKVTLTLLFIAGIVNFLDRSSLSVAGEAIRGSSGSARPNLAYCSPPSRYHMVSRSCPRGFCSTASARGSYWGRG